MFKRSSLIVFILYFIHLEAMAYVIGEQPWWLDEANKKIEQAYRTDQLWLENKQSKSVFILAGEWLTIKSDLDGVEIWRGQTFSLMRKVPSSELYCDKNSCRLSASLKNNVVRFFNTAEQRTFLHVSLGKHSKRPDPFIELLKLPLPVSKLDTRNNHETYYQLPNDKAFKVFVPEAKKMRVSIRRALTDYKTSAAVTVFINKEPVSVLSIKNRQDFQFQNKRVSLRTRDYIDVPANSYLTFKSDGSTLLQVKMMRRDAYDFGASRQFEEHLFNPYWTKSLNSRFGKIYAFNDISALLSPMQGDYANLQNKRKRELIDIVSRPLTLKPLNGAHRITSHIGDYWLNEPLQATDRTLKASKSFANKTLFSTEQALNFDLAERNLVQNFVTLYAKSTELTQVTVKSNTTEYTLILKPTEFVNKIRLPFAFTSKKLSLFFSNKGNTPVYSAIDTLKLLDFPESDVLYLQTGLLRNKSPVIANLIQRKKNQLAAAYLRNLPNYESDNVLSKYDVKLTKLHHLKLLGEAKSYVKTQTIRALPILKELTNSHDKIIVLEAWRLRIQALLLLDKKILATHYLEALVKSETGQLRQFAAAKLLNFYQSENEFSRIFGLCAITNLQLTKCKSLFASLQFSRMDKLFSAWLIHDEVPTHSLAELIKRKGINELVTKQIQEEENRHYKVEHYGNVLLNSQTSEFSSYQVKAETRFSITAQADMSFSLNARGKWQKTSEKEHQWVYLQRQNEQYILPVFTDIGSASIIKQTKEQVSIGSETIFSLKKGEFLSVTSPKTLFISIKELTHDEPDLMQLVPKHALFFKQRPLNELLNNPALSLSTLLTNALYQLDKGQVSQYEFLMLFSRFFKKIKQSTSLLASRVLGFGHWQAFANYGNYGGTELYDVDRLEYQSMSDKIKRHTLESQTPINAIPVRANHTVYINLDNFQHEQLRLKFYLSHGELYEQNTSQVKISAKETVKLINVSAQNQFYQLSKREVLGKDLKIDWQDPYLSQFLAVEVQYFDKGQWQTLPADTRQLFYRSSINQPVEIDLSQDQLLKVEIINEQGRSESTHFYPAGQFVISNNTQHLVRAYRWQLKKQPQKKLTYTPLKHYDYYQPKALKGNNPITVQKYTAYELANTDINIQTYLSHQFTNLYSPEGVKKDENATDLGVRLRKNNDEHWFFLDASYREYETSKDTFSLQLQHDWLAPQSHWFTRTTLRSRTRLSNSDSKRYVRANLKFRVGQKYRYNSIHQHQWWLEPFYNYQNINELDYYLYNDSLSNDVFNFYNQNHNKGLLAGYTYKYHMFNDTRFIMGGTVSSNNDFKSIDKFDFTAGVEQFYKGHVFSAFTRSTYALADDNRFYTQWYHLTQLSWLTDFMISEKWAGQVKFSWTQDWFNSKHAVRLELNVGNLPHTGYTPFAHDEIIFKSLRLADLLEGQVHDE